MLRILQVNDRGVVFESREAFEIGSMIELGFHVQYHVDGSSNSRLARNEFITGDGMVVDCNLCASKNGEPVHEVTLLFSEISPRDCRALRRFKRMEETEQLLAKAAQAAEFGLN
ncbi:MAG: hypothetical protein AAF585_07400 [Verrucomicrobiota bacterium]